MKLPDPPYWSVIFPNQRTDIDDKGYDAMADHMVELALQQPGCLGFNSVRDGDGQGITISYWKSLDDIKAWKDHPEHQNAQALGREKWYVEYDLLIAKVERSYHFKASKQA